MSPETDHNQEPSAPEPPNGEPTANNFAAAPAPAAQPQSASGAAAAVARAQEPPSPVASAVESDASGNQDSISRDERAGVGAAESTPEAVLSETSAPAETSEATETTEPTETMDQLLDQFRFRSRPAKAKYSMGACWP